MNFDEENHESLQHYVSGILNVFCCILQVLASGYWKSSEYVLQPSYAIYLYIR